MSVVAWLAAGLSLAAWVYLVAGRGGFWRADQWLEPRPPPAAAPGVVAVVPARNEADVIERTLAALLAQDYPGPFRVVVVDDHSDDGTAAAAARAADRLGAGERLAIVAAPALPAGWTGKLWAMDRGVARAAAVDREVRYLWFTDADIEHDPAALGALVAKAEAERLNLVSTMVRLPCESAWERLLVPAFVFFFQKLYPFPWVNDPGRATAAAAGGSMLVWRDALAGAGGLAAFGDSLIDDCALARAVKREGAIWLGLTEASRSLRRYGGLAPLWATVARTAFAQLNRSWTLLAGTVLAMAVVYLGPPLAVAAWAATLDAAPAAAGAAAWALMAAAYAPTLRIYRQPAWRALALPAAAALFTAMTVDSALAHLRGRGGAWKGRTHASRP